MFDRPETSAPQHREYRCANGLLATMALVWSLLHMQCASADVFAFQADDGVAHFSDQPTDPRYRLLMRTGEPVARQPAVAAPHLLANRVAPMLAAAISAAAQANGIEEALLHAVVKTESGYNPSAVSPKGAMGLMQLMPDTARRYGVANPLDIRQNLNGGARHLGELMQMFPNKLELALAAYNAGAGAVISHGRRIPPYAETMRYVPTVMRNYGLLRRATTER